MWDVYRDSEYVGTVDGERRGSLQVPEQHRGNIYDQAQVCAVGDIEETVCRDADGTYYHLRRAREPELELGL